MDSAFSQVPIQKVELSEDRSKALEGKQKIQYTKWHAWVNNKTKTSVLWREYVDAASEYVRTHYQVYSAQIQEYIANLVTAPQEKWTYIEKHAELVERIEFLNKMKEKLVMPQDLESYMNPMAIKFSLFRKPNLDFIHLSRADALMLQRYENKTKDMWEEVPDDIKGNPTQDSDEWRTFADAANGWIKIWHEIYNSQIDKELEFLNNLKINETLIKNQAAAIKSMKELKKISKELQMNKTEHFPFI